MWEAAWGVVWTKCYGEESTVSFVACFDHSTLSSVLTLNRALTDRYSAAGLRVYSRPDDGDVYADAVVATATQKSADDEFQPTLIVLGLRLGIEKINPIYYPALRSALESRFSVGIAGGRPSSSHYFIGHQDDQFFYLDPHTTRPALPWQPSPEDVRTCHTRTVRRLAAAEMDPSMLLGFLVRTREEFKSWRAEQGKERPAIIHVHDRKLTNEVETWDEDSEASMG